ncbi:MBL fold metallo-hydrolase [Gracilibacillus sp. S3-1-1]|uniref:MBL fold metallo-hydrolase n=1 Tax=Gracilibacillus pellucidus TaxID=3095368 RepID=A0ACC6M3M9_9BACI|nr:MBL fold metallo-hydrolase [Gracilibacillus sp. S3-1-1]MDX8045570.1 MBL fold metallo-hydrolase [Gracilibacillus sp. S3-1-1]
MLDVCALGGVGEYGRNCFLVTDQQTNTRILLDCGVRNGEPEIYPSITEEVATSIQAVFISHVHNDHVGALPLLAAKGFIGDIWMSEASFEQMPAIMRNWQGKQGITAMDKLYFRPFAKNSRGKRIKLTENLSITWGYSGHMLGSVWYLIQIGEQTLFYSGDIALASPLLVTDRPIINTYDVALIDSGHGAQTMPYHKSMTNIVQGMTNPLEKYLIPVTLSGKAGDLLFSLFHKLPDRTFIIDDSLQKHLYHYLEHTDNIHNDRWEKFKAMLQSNRLEMYQKTRKPGIYLLTSKPSGFHEINTSIYEDEESPFYKSHPDFTDVQTLTQTIDAERFIFFHSKQADLVRMLDSLDVKTGGILK